MQNEILTDIDSFVIEQKESWQLAFENYTALKKIRTKIFEISNNKISVQYNPERIRSSSASVDKKTIRQRKCFLCDENRPAEQGNFSINSFYNLLLNPYPIFDPHFTISSVKHKPQMILSELEHLFFITDKLGDKYSICYNGPECGASAPDHMHFQACLKDTLPIVNEYFIQKEKSDNVKVYKDKSKIYFIDDGLRRYLAVEFFDFESGKSRIKEIFETLEKIDDYEFEPKINLLSLKKEEKYEVLIFPRYKHRPAFYYNEGSDKILISPAVMDMGGVVVCPREEDFIKVNEGIITEMYREICFSEEKFSELVCLLNSDKT